MTYPQARIKRPFQIIRAHGRAYFAINAVVYGAFLIGFFAAMIYPDLGAARVSSLEDDGTNDLVRSLVTRPWLFALVILAVNLFTAAAPHILLPSLVVPFAGVAVFAYKAFTLGLGLFPTTDIAAVGLIPHSLTALIEFQAYSLLVLGGYLLAVAWLRPATVGAPNRRRGYVRGLQQYGSLAMLAVPLFIIGAVYEALSLRYLVHPLSELIL